MSDAPPPLWHDLIRTNRKTLGITVRPDKTVLLRAPLDANDEQIEAKVLRRQRWIKRQQSFFERYDPRTSERRYVSGEGHLYLGRRYRLKVIRGEKPGVRLWAGYIEVRCGTNADPTDVQRRLVGWYRIQAKRHFRELLDQTLATRFPGLELGGVQIKQMKRRWGSCGRDRVLILNLDLIRAPRSCIEYVIVHELCHVREPNHSKRFYRQLEGILPEWRARKERLERLLV